jgi:phosphohistidine phosphatase
MKTLLLVRHADANPTDPALADRDRTLNERGLREVATMGLRLAKRGVKPDLLLASPATRALTTAEHLATALGIEREDIVVDDRLYATSASALLGAIAAWGDGPERVMLVAHNPGLTELACRFADEITHMPTCAVAELTFEVASWGEIAKARPARVVFEVPKNG